MAKTLLDQVKFGGQFFRLPPDAYKALRSRPGSRIKRYSIATTATQKIAEKGDRHTAHVRNLDAAATVRLAFSKEDAESTDKYLELRPGEQMDFDIHYSGLQLLTEGAWQQIFHCETDDEIWINNPSAGTVVVSIFEVN